MNNYFIHHFNASDKILENSRTSNSLTFSEATQSPQATSFGTDFNALSANGAWRRMREEASFEGNLSYSEG